jgi:hypothetical protein
VEAKLSGLMTGGQWQNFQRCGEEEIIRRCKGCGDRNSFYYNCGLKWCPQCNWKITERRKRELTLITRTVTQAKHLVLTQTNFDLLTSTKIGKSRGALTKLLRQKPCREIKGGCASLEFTNEDKGFHMHWHLLLDVRWLDMSEISKRWGRLMGQEYAIVKIKDVRHEDYLREVCKYVVTGQELAGWKPEHIHQFVRAVSKRRLFTVFGDFVPKREEARREIQRQKNSLPGRTCKCGCDQFEFGTERDLLLRELREQGRAKRNR